MSCSFVVGLVLLLIFFYLAFVQQKRINKIKSNVDNINRLLSTDENRIAEESEKIKELEV
jgi:hypothetical protein